MNMKQIELVLAVASEGSINKAAQKLYLSQSNLSTSLKNLEKEFGQPLFERTSKGVVLTPFGKNFITIAQPVYKQYKLLDDFLDSAQHPTLARLSVASQNFRFATSFFSDICQKNSSSNYSFSYMEGSMFEVINMVHSREAELGIIVLPSYDQKLILYMLKQNDIRYECLTRVVPSVMVREGHPLAQNGKTAIDPADLRGYPIIKYPDESYTAFSDWNALGFSNSKKQIVINSRGALFEILGRTDAFTLGANKASAYKKTPDYSGVKTLHLAVYNHMLEIGYIQSAGHSLSAIATEYLNSIRDALKENDS